MATRNQGDNKETTALERVRRNRWVTRVEKTADLLLSLLEDAPKLGYRKPHFPLELESKLKEFLYGVETPGTIGLVDPPEKDKALLKSLEPTKFTLCLNEKKKASLAEFLDTNEKNEEWSKWTMNEEHNYYVKTGHKQSMLFLKLAYKSSDKGIHPVGRFKLDLQKLEKRNLVRKRTVNGSPVFDIRIVFNQDKSNATTEMVSVPNYLDEGIRALALQWKDDPARPTVKPDVEVRYESELRKWIRNIDLPMLIRKHRRNRGHELRHQSGRVIVPVDNAPANFIFSSALFEHPFKASDVPKLLEEKTLPIGMIADTGAKYLGQLKIRMNPPNLNHLNYKVAHIEDVGIGHGDIEKMDMADLKTHMYNLLSVTNIFVIPKQYGSLGELSEFKRLMKK